MGSKILGCGLSGSENPYFFESNYFDSEHDSRVFIPNYFIHLRDYTVFQPKSPQYEYNIGCNCNRNKFLPALTQPRYCVHYAFYNVRSSSVFPIFRTQKTRNLQTTHNII